MVTAALSMIANLIHIMMKETWCLVSIEGHETKAKIIHMGRGKFKILDDEGRKYIGKIVDASDVVHCKFAVNA